MKTQCLRILFVALFYFLISVTGTSLVQADDVMDDDLSPCKTDCQDDYEVCQDNNADEGDCADQLEQCKEECDSE